MGMKNVSDSTISIEQLQDENRKLQEQVSKLEHQKAELTWS